MPNDSPDYDLDALAASCRAHRDAGRRVVLCHGCFDLLHVGHVRYLQAAKQLGDVLLVTVTPDRFVGKGPGRPAFPEAQRAEMLAALGCVERVALNRWPTAVEMLERVQPDVYAKGAEYAEAAQDPNTPVGQERATVEAHGGQLALIDTEKFSSTEILSRLASRP
ncbi:adenylyltransferase/cytidyltransferase family protein [Algisphaera agarilytica]|uniref:RfaE bifunctional protein nucleotidyltransferase chain/domain n=1 Tax=Algisphaera agarilytica TaxID=1385975 RepID=A0A7X0H6P3_9BACT|nr:adenylyltransferase/cytidyltransferase family protein [Algisphaera agarilytica]MBB6430123.1 rfaE bifunctional protein nucleotidyltransferase chain/domain [Algisphaera agarilytica]